MFSFRYIDYIDIDHFRCRCFGTSMFSFRCPITIEQDTFFRELRIFGHSSKEWGYGGEDVPKWNRCSLGFKWNICEFFHDSILLPISHQLNTLADIPLKSQRTFIPSAYVLPARTLTGKVTTTFLYTVWIGLDTLLFFRD